MTEKNQNLAVFVVVLAVTGMIAFGIRVDAGPAYHESSLPPAFSVGHRVIGPAGRVHTVAAVSGNWVKVEPAGPINVGDPAIGRTIEVESQWLHVPSGLIWGSVTP